MPGHVKYPNLPAQELSRLARFRQQMEAQLLNLGAAIQDARNARNWSRARLAREIPVDPKTVERWEKGLTGGAMESLTAIAEALETTVDDLLAAAAAKARQSSGGTKQGGAGSGESIEEKLDLLLSQQAQLISDLSEVRSELEAQREPLGLDERDSAATGK